MTGRAWRRSEDVAEPEMFPMKYAVILRERRVEP